MNDLPQLIELARQINGCVVHPPCRLPAAVIDGSVIIPDDLHRFYELTGGIDLYLDQDFGFRIPAPDEFIRANEVFGSPDYFREHAEECGSASNWWAIGYGSGPEEGISIDLTEAFLGLCYDSFHEVHATEDSKIVARSFSEFLSRALNAKGDELWWEDSDFPDYGYATIKPTKPNKRMESNG